MKLENLLKNLDTHGKATTKGREIAKALKVKRHVRKDYDIEVTAVEPIDGGVQVFARVWKDGKQIGFGKDGTVDIERFRFFNPPVLVDDENGDIVRDSEIDGVKKERRLREDLEEAILQALEHTISVKKEVFDDSKIVAGKVGNTTSTFYPAAGENSPCDGYVERSGVNETFSTIRSAASGTTTNVVNNWLYAYIHASATTNQFDDFSRPIINFDTSDIGSDEISSAVFSGNVYDKHTLLGSTTLDIVSASPAATNTIAAGDYDSLGTTVFADVDISSAVSPGSYENFTLSSAGIEHINKDGVTSFGLRLGWDTDNSFGGKWKAQDSSSLSFYSTDYTGTSSDPKLVVEHAAAGPTGVKTINGVAIASVKTINGVATGGVKSINGSA